MKERYIIRFSYYGYWDAIIKDYNDISCASQYMSNDDARKVIFKDLPDGNYEIVKIYIK